MFKRIDHVEIIPADFNKTVSFYTDVLGFTVKERRKIDMPPMEEIAFLDLGGTLVEVISVTNPTPASGNPWQIGYPRIALEVDDIEGTVEYLKLKKVKITLDPVNIGNAVRATFDDPDGLPIEIKQVL